MQNGDTFEPQGLFKISGSITSNSIAGWAVVREIQLPPESQPTASRQQKSQSAVNVSNNLKLPRMLFDVFDCSAALLQIDFLLVGSLVVVGWLFCDSGVG